jgi:hypothetical protein
MMIGEELMEDAEENEEIEVIDVSLSEGEIDEVIANLIELKEHKKSVQFPLASDLDLSVTFSDDETISEDSDDVEGTVSNLNDSETEEIKNG